MGDRAISDYPGRSRLAANVAAGWLANTVTLVIGFVMPRLIYDSVGMAALGIWDLSWSLLAYVTASGLGTASAITHFVARYRETAQPDELATTIATGFHLQLLFALGAGAAFVTLLTALPFWIPYADVAAGEQLLLLGGVMAATAGIALVGDVNQGILNGCHRGAINEILVLTGEVALAIAMIAVVFTGRGIIGLAVVTLATRCAFELVRLVVTVRVCPQASVRPGLWRRRRARDLLTFSTKSSIGITQELLVHQLARLALMASAGPVALACYSRYATLARQISRSIDRLTYVVPPIASGLMGQGLHKQIAWFGQRASSAALMATMPIAVAFGVFGDEIVRIWMGPEFVAPGVAWTLAVMALIQADRSVATRVLSGMNAHGRVALFCLASSAIVFAALMIWLYPLDPLRTAVLVSLTMIAGVFVPHLLLSSRKLGIRPSRYLRTVYARPILCNLIFLAGLLLAQHWLKSGAPVSAGATLAGFAVLLGFLYWFLAFDERMRTRIRSTLQRWAT